MKKSKAFKKQKAFVDKFIFVVAIVEPLFTLPQAYAIFNTRNAAGVSILTWMGYTVMTSIWVWYAINREDKVVLLYQGLFLMFDILVTVGAFLYGGQWF